MKVLKYGGLDIDPTRLSESTTVRIPAIKETILQESVGGSNFIMPRIEAIHSGRTKNFTHYPAEKLKGDASLKSGVYSWLDPYGKPVIYNHDLETEVTGRVERAAYAEYTQAGRPGIIVVPKITEPKAIQAIKDGRLLTVSIGATTDEAICSICGTDIVNEGYCGHMKGEEYDGVVAEWITGNLWFDELSWVNLPADQNAMVTDIETSLLMSAGDSSYEESVNDKKPKTVNEYYNVPNRITVVEAVKPKVSKESKEQEGREKMNKETIEEEVTEEEVLETDTKETEVEVKVDAPEVEAEAEEAEEVKVEEEKAEAKAEEVIKDEAVSAETTEKVDALTAVNIALEAQVNALTDELREFYRKEILSKVTMEEEAKEKFAARLDERSLDSLKENLSDLEEGFFVSQAKTTTAKKREVVKVESPIKEEVEKQKESTQNERVAFFTSLLGNN